MKNLSLVAVAFLAAAAALAQTSLSPLKFEVASVKPADPHFPGASSSRDAGEGLEIRNVPVRNLITLAYGLRDFQLIGAPGWADSENYDVSAKAPAGNLTGTTPESADQRNARFDRVRERLRSLLTDRFGLVVHHETRSQSVYVMTVADKGLRMAKVAAPDGPPHIEEGRGHSQGFAVPIGMLVTKLSDATHLTVVDHTGLTGRYDYTLNWDPRSTSLSGEPNNAPLDSAGPTIFTALNEQLGLVLKAGKAPVDVIVVDHVDRPSPN